MFKSFKLSSISELTCPVDYILSLISENKIFYLIGDLGSGKTTFIQSLLLKLNYTYKVNSPTFARVHEYETLLYKIYHLDLYRISPLIDEFEELLIEENAKIFIEWANLLTYKEKINEKTITIKFEVKPNSEERNIIVMSEQDLKSKLNKILSKFDENINHSLEEDFKIINQKSIALSNSLKRCFEEARQSNRFMSAYICGLEKKYMHLSETELLRELIKPFEKEDFMIFREFVRLLRACSLHIDGKISERIKKAYNKTLFSDRVLLAYFC